MAIGIEAKGESFGLLVDAVGEVLKLSDSSARPIRSISTASLPPYRPASIALTDSCWSFSMSTVCWTSRGEAAAA